MQRQVRLLKKYFSIACVISTVFLSGNQSAQAQTFKESDYFYFAYALTYGYDFCGNEEIGTKLRVIVGRLLDKCRLSAADREAAQHRIDAAPDEMSKDYKDVMKHRALLEKQGKDPGSREFFSQFKCDDSSYKTKVDDISKKISNYDAGRLDENGVEPGVCWK